MQRGVLRGGSLRRFFDDFLPRADLRERVIAEGLGRARVDPRSELRPALHEGLEELVATFEADRKSGLHTAKKRRAELSAGTYAPLRALADVLADLLRQQGV